MAELCLLADRAQDIVPDLVGVSLARLAYGLTFTVVATAPEIAVLDGIQYLAGGPCVNAAHTNQPVRFDNDDPLDEERWRFFAQATAAHTVRTTLTLPLMNQGRALGTVNLYAASQRAFLGHHDELAGIFGAWAAGAVTNADLAFTTRREAQAAPDRVRKQLVIDLATASQPLNSASVSRPPRRACKTQPYAPASACPTSPRRSSLHTRRQIETRIDRVPTLIGTSASALAGESH
ncbi:MAG: GAF domain-containing protein [Nocardioides sp.]